MTSMAQLPDDVSLSAPFQTLRKAYAEEPYPDYRTRIDRLGRLEAALLDYGDRLIAAMNADFSHRCEVECRLLDLNPTLGDLRSERRNLKRRMKTRRAPVPLYLRPAKGRIRPQPLGVVGVISPWNFPLYMAIPPVASALAAGNRVMLKPSELSPRTSGLVREMIEDAFAPDEVAVVTGGPDVAQAFSALPFDHLIFTGSTAVGRKVALAAAANLTPVTLELGGKSPAIVTPSADLDRAADRIAWGKVASAGQMCVAPDYALVPRAQMRDFADRLMTALQRAYPEGSDSPDLCAIITERHLERLNNLVDQARASGAAILQLPGQVPDGIRKIAPTLILDPSPNLGVMQEEVFGPILSIIPYDSQEEALNFVAARDRPLALYVFAADRQDRDLWLKQSISGGACINDVVLHVGCDMLPFGGVGASGQGAYHGDTGFETFSHMKSIFVQSRLNGLKLLMPPYTGLSRKMARFLQKLI